MGEENLEIQRGRDATYAARHARGRLDAASQMLDITYYDMGSAREHAVRALVEVDEAARHLFGMLEASGVDISPLSIEDFGDPQVAASVMGHVSGDS